MKRALLALLVLALVLIVRFVFTGDKQIDEPVEFTKQQGDFEIHIYLIDEGNQWKISRGLEYTGEKQEIELSHGTPLIDVTNDKQPNVSNKDYAISHVLKPGDIYNPDTPVYFKKTEDKVFSGVAQFQVDNQDITIPFTMK